MDKTGIANLALSNLGEARIQSLTEDSSRARACSARMDQVIESVLRMHVWNSALERQLLVTGDTPIFGWNYSYQLPADCIKVVEVEPVSKYQVEKKYILSNETSLYLLYVATPTDINNLDSLLAEAIAMKLAVEVAETLTSKQGLKQEMMQNLTKILMKNVLQEILALNEHNYSQKNNLLRQTIRIMTIKRDCSNLHTTSLTVETLHSKEPW